MEINKQKWTLREIILLICYGSIFWTGDIIKNILFIVPIMQKYDRQIIYTFFLLYILIFFYKELKSEGRELKINTEKNLKFTMIIGIVVICGEVITSIVLSKLNIFSANGISLEKTLRYEMFAFMTMVIMGPFVEEFIYRKILYGRFKSKKEGWHIPACVVTSVIFTINHCLLELLQGEYIQLAANIPVFIAGVGYTLTYEKTRNIYYAILLHSAINFIAFRG